MRILFVIILNVSLAFLSFNGKNTVPEKMKPAEQKLFSDINNYRKSLGLAEIPFSSKLTRVAQIHAADLRDHFSSGKCNMHSWSGKGEGFACCYTPDHKNAHCMWDKPQELTGYQEKGYEISAMNTAPEVNWLNQWKGSPGHHQVIINNGIWKTIEWKAMGLAIRGEYAVVWFGVLEDPVAKK